MSTKVLTANRLSDGGVVYLTADGAWSENLQSAATAAPEQEAELTARAQEAVAACLVVEPYLFPVTRQDGRLAAASQRERIRAAGPTVDAGPVEEATERAHVSL